MVGVALSGVLIGGGLSSANQDPIYPPNYSGYGNGADVCGQHVNPYGMLHYHYMPQCVSTGNSTLHNAASVTDYVPSTTYNRTYAGLQGFTSTNYL